MAATKGKRALTTRTYKEKYDILKFIEQNPTMKKKDVALRFNIKPNTLSDILKRKDDIVKVVEEKSSVTGKLKRIKTISFDDVDRALLVWFRQKVVVPSLRIDGEVLLTKANEFAREFGHEQLINLSWIDRFKKRHGIGKAGEAGGVADEWVNEWKQGGLREILKNFEPQDIYNADETGLFWQMLPEQSLGFVGQKYSGAKQPKTRITVLVCANMDGSDKVPSFVIGKSKKPHAFRGVKVPVEYAANRKALMTGDLFEAWLHKFDKEMRFQGRKIAMILDDCTAHPKLTNLKNITLFFLPPNTTSLTQPMDGGIIKNLKHHYRKILSSKRLAAIDADEEFKWNILDAVISLKTAWGRVTPETISNVYKNVGFITNDEMLNEQPLDDEDESVDQLELDADEINGEEIRQEEEEMRYIWEKLGEMFELPSLDDYLNVDDAVDVVEQLSDREIVESITATDDESLDDEEDDDEENTQADDQPISLSDVFKANDLIRKFNLSLNIDCPDEILAMSDQYELFLLGVASKNLEQKKINENGIKCLLN